MSPHEAARTSSSRAASRTPADHGGHAAPGVPRLPVPAQSGSADRPGSAARTVPDRTAPPAPARPEAVPARGAHGIHDTAPAARWEDCHLTGNGRHGALVHGATADETVVVTHHAMVRPRAAASPEPPLPDPAAALRELQDALVAGVRRAPAAPDATAQDAPAPAPAAAQDGPDGPRPFHPAFAVRWHRTDARPATHYRRRLDFRTGVTSAAWREDPGEGEWYASCFTSRADDAVVQHLAAPPGRTVEAVVDLDGRLPGSPPELRLAVRSVYRPGPLAAPAAPGAPASPPAPRDSALLRLRARYPDSETGYRGATRVVAVGGEVVCDGPRIRVTGARELLLVTRTARGPVTADCPELAGLDTGMYAIPDDPAALLARHVRLHREAYDRVALDLGGDPAERALPVAELLERQAATPGRLTPALLELLFAAGRHHLLSAAGHRPPRLCGLWTGTWDAEGAGGFAAGPHLGLQTASAAAAGLPEVSLAHAELVLGQLDDWRSNARRLFGTRGAVAPARTDGEDGLLGPGGDPWEHPVWTAAADWLLLPLLEHAETTGDEGFLRGRLLPALIDTAVFYEDFLTRTGPDGRVVVVPSCPPGSLPGEPGDRPGEAEAGGRGPAVSVNATADIAAARHALTTAAALCTRYRPDGITPERTTLWRQLAARLPDYRVDGDGALSEWAWPAHRDVRDRRGTGHLHPVWPLDEITPEDTPALAAAARTALRLGGDGDESGHGHLHRALAAARLEDAALAARHLSRLLDRDFFFRSLMSSRRPYRDTLGADVAHGLPALLVEMLVRSRPGRPDGAARLTLLPALPDTLPTGTLTGVRTRFGATVAELAWDLGAGRVRAVLRADADRTVALRVGRPAAAIRVAGGPPLPRGANGAVRIGLRAGEETVVTAEAAVPRQVR
ncbi:glycoside hydrolase N-terminal domain-containing protein [Streptomyces sp. NPDC001380]|uniref:glycosyl hydrolase family 95 catalytic domain-containing protein n=1 Tax=Streptomyces sp. NPDC001380 TaxID=3364566 RepID=UPI0036A6B3CD